MTPKKGQTTIYKTLYRKLKIEQHNPTKNGGELMCSGRVNTETQGTLGTRHRMKTNKSKNTSQRKIKR
jgi:hypothetical protein